MKTNAEEALSKLEIKTQGSGWTSVLPGAGIGTACQENAISKGSADLCGNSQLPEVQKALLREGRVSCFYCREPVKWL